MIVSRTILYTFKNEDKTLTFTYERYRNIHEAVADAEQINISDYLKMEAQLEAISDAKAVKNYRDNYFKKLGFSKITLKPKENRGIGNK